MSEVEKDVCLECGVEIVDGGSWQRCRPCSNEVFDKLIQNIGRGLMNEQDNFKESYNVHDPHNKHVWVEEESLTWVLIKIVGGGSIAAALLICMTIGVLSL